MWKYLIYGFCGLVETLVERQAMLGPLEWADEMRQVVRRKQASEEQVLLMLAHTLVSLERALLGKGNLAFGVTWETPQKCADRD
jgi:hypothetical protein